MKNRIIVSILPFILFTGILFTGCKDEEQPLINNATVPNEVNSFVWSGLHDYYLWKNEVPNLSDTKYNNSNTLNTFLNSYTDPQNLFEDLLYQPGKVDKWSFLVDNSKEIDDWISGISETMGYDLMLGRIGGSDDLFGFVRYVYKGSPAEKAGVKRGDIFLQVNDQKLTVSNYMELLFNTPSYKLSFATIADGHVTLNGRSVNMTAITMQENPILLDTVFIANNQKVGYLVYNGFNSDFDLQLNEAMENFKAANIDQLVIDLRYNGGGSVQTSIYLASMIYSTDATKLFAVAHYNKELEDLIVQQEGSNFLKNNFVTKIDPTDSHGAVLISSLNLHKIYFIVSDNTASASELLINGLKPYMDVKVVGDSTVGKYTGSITIKDEDENGKAISTWAMQPIIVKFANSQGVSDFVKGLFPDIYMEEDFRHLLPLGDPNETLLKVVLDDMQGIPVTAQTLKSAKLAVKKVADSHDFKRFSNDMYVNPDLLKNLKR